MQVIGTPSSVQLCEVAALAGAPLLKSTSKVCTGEDNQRQD